MKIELNIGLDVKGGINTPLLRAHQETLARTTLKAFKPRCERFLTSYAGPDGQVTEAMLFVALDANNLFDVVKIVYALATELQQDCIAVYLPEADEGTLVGRNCAHWGEFNGDSFTSAAGAERLAA